MSIHDDLKISEIFDSGRLKFNSFIRNRKLNFVDIMWLIIYRRGLSLSLDLHDYCKIKKIVRVSKQAFSKARKNINPEVFKVLNFKYLNRAYENTKYKTFMGYVLLAIDGCNLNLLNDKTLKEEYGGITNKDDMVVRVKAISSGIYDCLNNMMINFKIAPYKTSEKELAIKNIEEALKLFKSEQMIIIFNRGYPSLELFNYLMKKGIKFLFRIKTDSYKKEKRSMKTNDEFIDFIISKSQVNHIKNEQVKKDLLKTRKHSLRITKVKLSTGARTFNK
jgi:hypothetical protein